MDYFARQVVDNDLLADIDTGRSPVTVVNGEPIYSTSLNQVLFIGRLTAYDLPEMKFVKLHELIARILHARGGAEELQKCLEEDDERKESLFKPEIVDETLVLLEKAKDILTQWSMTNTEI
ncbi:hypothetical protein BCR33DRAFT_740640 [Rhizoclosmatium globosum]|uniref:Uncharacterized protein n=1 Tax=Rhizoclosmatium globosum TaxID=329046 RepID=A0A1Y2BZ77_9FUNG|nr:hypothetical protein BCR33DRAFT_740640 [Rhizoclosmatium globosum]|eukprot:ORY39974.1 hypothetical protein BCR33DRAFT_740640 [Rhizoclosmatium globosum]